MRYSEAAGQSVGKNQNHQQDNRQWAEQAGPVACQPGKVDCSESGPDYHKEAQGIDTECFQAEEHPDILIIDKVPGNKKRIEDKRYEKGQGVQDEEKPKPQE